MGLRLLGESAKLVHRERVPAARPNRGQQLGSQLPLLTTCSARSNIVAACTSGTRIELLNGGVDHLAEALRPLFLVSGH